MKLKSSSLFVLLFGIVGSVYMPAANAHELQLQIDNIKVLKGTVRVIIYNDKAAYDANEAPISKHQEAVSSESMIINFGDLPSGNYAIKLYHDENDNGKLDFGFMGIPAEGYGYSNNGGKFGPSSFDDAKFELQNPMTINIKMR